MQPQIIQVHSFLQEIGFPYYSTLIHNLCLPTTAFFLITPIMHQYTEKLHISENGLQDIHCHQKRKKSQDATACHIIFNHSIIYPPEIIISFEAIPIQMNNQLELQSWIQFHALLPGHSPISKGRGQLLWKTGEDFPGPQLLYSQEDEILMKVLYEIW